MPIIFHRRNAPKAIRTDAERERAAAQIAFLQAAVAKLARGKPSRRNDGTAARCEEIMCAREAEIREYDALKRGEWKLPKVERLDQVPPLIPKIRIARGISQTELAHRLGVSKQAVSRYEESEYRTVGLARLQEILDALGAKALIDLRA